MIIKLSLYKARFLLKGEKFFIDYFKNRNIRIIYKIYINYLEN